MDEKRIFFLLHRAQRKLKKFADKVYLKSLGISSTQVTTLFFLKQNDGCLLKDLSSGLYLNNSAVTGLVNRMEKSGLIVRKQSSGDGRAYQVFLTEKAKVLTSKAVPILMKANEVILEGYNQEEIELISRFLGSLVDFSDEEKLKNFNQYIV